MPNKAIDTNITMCASNFCQRFPLNCTLAYGCPTPRTPPRTPRTPPPTPPNIPDPDRLSRSTLEALQQLEDELQRNSDHPNPELVLQTAAIFQELNLHRGAIKLSQNVQRSITATNTRLDNELLTLLARGAELRGQSFRALGQAAPANEALIMAQTLQQVLKQSTEKA